MDLFRFFWRELKLCGARVYEPEDFEEAIAIAAAGRASDGPADHQYRAARRPGVGVPGDRERRRSDEDPGELRVNVLESVQVWMARRPWSRAASAGIGKAMALALAEAGADIVGVSKTLEPEGSDIEREVVALGRKFKGYACDFGDRSAVLRFARAGEGDFPAIDILVNNAGTILRKPAAEHPGRVLGRSDRDAISTAQFLISREIGKRMVERGAGKIIFTASLLTLPGRHHGTGLRGKQRARSASSPKRWPTSGRRKGVQVNAIAPGYINTDNTERSAGRSGAQPGHSVAHPGRALGRARGLQRRSRIPRVERVRLCQRIDSDCGWRLDGPVESLRPRQLQMPSSGESSRPVLTCTLGMSDSTPCYSFFERSASTAIPAGLRQVGS